MEDVQIHGGDEHDGYDINITFVLQGGLFIGKFVKMNGEEPV